MTIWPSEIGDGVLMRLESLRIVPTGSLEGIARARTISPLASASVRAGGLCGAARSRASSSSALRLPE
jgi:hypothetical protein